MHLRLNDQELTTLVEMLSLAASVASYNRKPESDDKVAIFEDLEDKILEKAAHAGMGSVIEFDADKQRHQLTLAYQDQSFFQDCLDEFRNESFWEELVIRFADRELIRKIGFPSWNRLSEEERRARTADIEKRYWDEFSKSGIDRLHLIHSHREG